ncbi:MAG TPA: Nif11 family protein [Candidatus Baltobacteraceae bacterium]|nr:Nif11 family protein [Candidatus Baltobacteraceae bacterium]
MANDPAAEYLDHLRNNPSQREKLRDAVFAEIVAAGEAAGYTFSEKHLANILLKHHFDTSQW